MDSKRQSTTIVNTSNTKPSHRRAPRTDTGKRTALSANNSGQSSASTGGATTGSTSPCGACKFLRRKCVNGCLFAPHFGSEQGPARFAAVHKIFGASNVSKMLMNVPAGRRHDAVLTICYEAQARLADPVYGCVSTILALQLQVASLQGELSVVHSQLINSQLAVTSTIQETQQLQQQQQQHVNRVLQPAFSNNSSVSNNMVNMSNNFPSSVVDQLRAETASNSRDFKALQLSQPSQHDEENEISQIPNDLIIKGVYSPK